jgi:hypothetical protein
MSDVENQTPPQAWVDAIIIPEARRIRVAVRFGAGTPVELAAGPIAVTEVDSKRHTGEFTPMISCHAIEGGKALAPLDFCSACWLIVAQAFESHTGRNGPPKTADGILFVHDAQDKLLTSPTKRIRRSDIPEWMVEQDKPETTSYGSLTRQQSTYIGELQKCNIALMTAVSTLITQFGDGMKNQAVAMNDVFVELQKNRGGNDFWTSDAGQLIMAELAGSVKPVVTGVVGMVGKRVIGRKKPG